jgi:uncharacterized coiled-coil protein SlyX
MPPKPEYAALCEQVRSLSERVERIETNHLAHIQDAIHELGERLHVLEVRIAYYMGAAAVLSTLLAKVIEITTK